jgi:ketosteroid isomerase-like protein
METLATVKQDVNLNVVKNAFDDFLRGNVAAVVNACTDDVEWGSYDNPATPYAKTYRGKSGVADFFATLAGAVDYQAFELKELHASGDRVFAKVYHKATVKSTARGFAHDFLMEFRLRDEKICNAFAYVDSRDQAAAFSEN